MPPNTHNQSDSLMTTTSTNYSTPERNSNNNNKMTQQTSNGDDNSAQSSPNNDSSTTTQNRSNSIIIDSLNKQKPYAPPTNNNSHVHGLSPISPAVKSGKQSRPNLDGMFDIEYDDDEMITSLSLATKNGHELDIPNVTTPTKGNGEDNNGDLDTSLTGSASSKGSARKKGMMRSSSLTEKSVAVGVAPASFKRSLPSPYNLPASIDDEIGDPHAVFVTSVDLSLIDNAAANALEALLKKEKDEEVVVTSENCIRPLICTAQNYAWGKHGSSALVAKMKANEHIIGDSFKIDEDKPYAELWIGTHPNGMSKILIDSSDEEEEDNTQTQQLVPLLDYVRTSPSKHCGVDDVEGVNFDLTFLFKVLSIEKVLSIQAHPDKRLAAQLHATRPQIYKDPNHKPEMAIALTEDFEALCGFRPITEIATHFTRYPEFATLIDDKAKESLTTSAKRRVLFPRRKELYDVFKSYMECSQETIETQLNKLLTRLDSLEEKTETEELILSLSKQFPNDCGIFAPLLFNYLKLKKGDAFFISANEPHAYIQGEILECMACSDNVVRAGLTPKIKDVDTLCNMLTYKTFLPEITRGIQYDNNCILYKPPVDDFAMEIITISKDEEYTLNNVRSPSVILVLEGSGIIQQTNILELKIDFGKALFMSANTKATIIGGGSEGGMKIVRALTNVHL